MAKEIEHLLALSLIKGVGGAFIKTRLTEIETYINDIDLLGNMVGGKVTKNSIEENLPMAINILDDCKNHNIEALSILDSSYPPLLKEIKNPPPILYLKGNKDNLDNCLAVIGTRKSDDLGNNIANKIGQYLSKNWSICNGLVDGIDKNSIINDGSVFQNITGVLSGGLNYEKTSSKITIGLAEQVLNNNGLLVSENPPNKKEDQFSGSKASRIQAGLSKGLILVQSSKTGGSKYTLKSFSTLGRTIAVVDYSGNTSFDEDEGFSGNRLLLEKGVEGVAEMCEIKKLNSLKGIKIIGFSSKEDYLEFEQKIRD